MRRPAALALALAAVLLAACGGDSTGPSKSTVAGTYDFAITNLGDDSFACSGTGMRMSLAMTGDGTFSGSHTGGTITCHSGSQSASDQFAPGPILNGTLHGGTVEFDMDDTSMHFSGTVNSKDDTMAGTIVATSSDGTLSGEWTATYVATGQESRASLSAGAPDTRPTARPFGSFLR